MPTTDDLRTARGAFDLVGRIQPETAAETLHSDFWTLYAIVEDPVTGRPVTLIRHTRHPHVMVVEEPVDSTAGRAHRADSDPEDRPGPWPDA